MQSFHTSNTEELTLDKGVVVSVMENRPSGWSWVTNVDVGTGWFPTCYLELLDCSPDRMEKIAEPNVGGACASSQPYALCKSCSLIC